MSETPRPVTPALTSTFAESDEGRPEAAWAARLGKCGACPAMVIAAQLQLNGGDNDATACDLLEKRAESLGVSANEYARAVLKQNQHTTDGDAPVIGNGSRG